MRAILLLLLSLYLVGCGKAKSFDRGPSSKAALEVEVPSVVSMITNRLTEAEYFQRMHVEAYEQFGRKNPAWDAQAREFLEHFTNTTSVTPTRHAELVKEGETLEFLGCDDPLVRYRTLMLKYNPRKADASNTNLWMDVATDFDKSGYPLYWKLFSKIRAVQAVRAERWRSDVVPPYGEELGRTKSDRLIEFLQDRTLPTSVMFHAVKTAILDDLYNVPDYAKWSIDRLKPLILAGWSDTAEAWHAVGCFHMRNGFNERGTETSEKVSKAGWKALEENLGIAREAFEKAWSIKPMAITATEMLRVELGDSKGRSEMEKWFDRAMQLDPANHDACDAKLFWLLPQWHGSTEEMEKFSRQILTNSSWKGQVPIMAYKVHESLAKHHAFYKKGTEDSYWRIPGVWNEVKASFERLFALNPGPSSVGWRHDYVLAAYKAGAWDDLQKQLKLLGPMNYDFFGGRPAFEKIVQQADLHRPGG